MQPSDYPPILAIAMLAARADGTTDAAEQAAIEAALSRIGAPDVATQATALATGQPRLGDLARQLSGPDAKQLAWETALAVCHADGSANPAESQFLEHLQDVLGVSDAVASQQQQTATALAAAPIASGAPGQPAAGSTDEYILQQAILTGALEILPDRLANIAILPIQLRLVYHIGQRHGQKLDMNQVKDLAATLGLGAAAQSVEGVMMKVLGGLAGGLLGGLGGGATRIATGAVVSFTATYALGHVAEQYYAQGRKLSQSDLKTLFGRFQQEAHGIYPQVQQQIHTQSGSLNIQGLLASLRG
ncbi:MAG TPA: DUF533 domain-containing protein [Gemmatimonadales bacterium]|jgi:uncharacterized protein (DUF697 family)